MSSNSNEYLPSLHNPLLTNQDLPKFSSIEPKFVLPAVEYVIDLGSQLLAEIEGDIKKGQASWDQVIGRLDKIDRLFERSWGPVDHLVSVKNSSDLRAAHEAAEAKVVEFGLKISQSSAIFDWLKSVKNNHVLFDSLTSARKRIVELKLLSSRHSGADLEGKAKEEFAACAQALSKLNTQFSNNILDETKSYRLELKTQDDIVGLTPRIKEIFSTAWNQHKKDGEVLSNSEKGPWLVTIDATSYMLFMEYSSHRSLKQKIYMDRLTLASKQPFNNDALILEILSLRQKQAKLVGYDTFASMSLAKKMAGNYGKAYELMEDLRVKSFESGMKEHRALQDFAHDSGFSGELCEWDIPYFSRLMKEAKYSVDQEEIRKFFPVSTVTSGLFALIERLFNIRTEEVSRSVDVWHPDVKFVEFKDMNQGGKVIGGAYLDLFARPGSKRGGAWMNNCVTRSSYNGKVDLPIAYLICNGSPPLQGQEALMNFEEVRTLFHEFGHGLQHLFTTVDDYQVSGIGGVEWDCVELASQFMENWVFEPKTLRALSKHIDTDEQLSDELIERIISARNFRSASMILRQLHFSITDLELHHVYDPSKVQTLTPHEVGMNVARKTSAFAPREEGRFLCSFSHIFAGGYAAGYYSYKWAEVLSADAFSAFEEAGLENEDQLQKIGLKYRSTVLALGGSKHPMDVYKSFRGREPTTDALIRHSGLSVT